MQKIDLPRISERIRGFTLPENGAMTVFDYDEVFLVSLQPPSVRVLDDNPYSFADLHPEHLGVSHNAPLLQVGSTTVSYSFDPAAPSQGVRLDLDGQVQEIPFRTLSGDWFIASLSRDGSYLVIAEPYLLEVYSLSLGEA
ncbi:MAG: hypothetical protein ACN6Q8_00730 [Stenotrophomonas sp.]